MRSVVVLLRFMALPRGRLFLSRIGVMYNHSI